MLVIPIVLQRIYDKNKSGKFNRNFPLCIYNHRTTKTNQKYPSVNL